ncbi:MAG: serine--tRNA ligase [Deltaproteobacteria bacterium]|nr:serine--tRNA ligase [Deltaproteobacteria bacterium]
MLDLKRVVNDFENVQRALLRRGPIAGLEQVAELAQQRKKLIAETQQQQEQRNRMGDQLKRAAKEEIEAARAQMRELGDAIKRGEAALRDVEAQLDELLLNIPNTPHDSVATGASSDDNPVVRVVGDRPTFGFEPKPHDVLGTALDLIDFERAGKVSGARFVFLKGLGARLERALIGFMLDLHTRRGDVELLPPYLVRPESMVGTGQLPKFEADAFHVPFGDSRLYLVPTAEVPVTNYHRGEILDEERLPLRYCAFTPCFRAEAGAAGKDTRGMIRQHQFHKVELVRFSAPGTSYQELERLVDDAEEVLRQLGLPYRVVQLCTADLGFSAAKCYDLEVWMPGQQAYREISSCSNFEDFQARRADIKYRPAGKKGKPQFVHTLNGSGLAIGRTLIAVLENYQQADGSIRIPSALVPYLGGIERIEPPSR